MDNLHKKDSEARLATILASISTVCSVITLALVLTQRQPQPIAPIVTMPKRFDVEFSPHMRFDTFLLDQQEGKIYISAEDKGNKMAFWKEMPLSE